MKPKLGYSLLYILFSLLATGAFAQSTYYAVRSGNWAAADDPIWASTPGGAPTLNGPDDPAAHVVIESGVTVELNVSGREMGSLTIAAGGTLTRSDATTHYVELHGPELVVDGTIEGNVGLNPRDGAITLYSNGGGSATFRRISKNNGGSCQLTIAMDATVAYGGSFAAITNQSGGVTGTGTLDIVVAAGSTLTVTQGDVSIDGVDGTNNNEGDGSLEIFGTLDLQNGNLYLTSDNDSGRDLNYSVAAGGLLIVNGTLIGNDVADMSGSAGAQVFFEVATGGELRLLGAGTGWQGLTSRNQVALQPGARVAYVGLADQQVAADFDYPDLYIANPVTALAGPTMVAGTLSFGSGGRLALGDFDLELSGTLTGNADGFVVTDGAGLLRVSLPEFTTLDLPLGPSIAEYAPCTLYRDPNGARSEGPALPKTGPASFGVAVSNSVPTGSTPAASLVGQRWTVVLLSGDGAGFYITPSWTSFDQQSNFNPASCYVSWRAGATAPWTGDMPAAATASGGYYQRTRGPITLTSDTDHEFIPASSGALPVRLLDFGATTTARTVELDWRTSGEFANAHFQIERSATGRTFLPIGRVAGFGTTADQQVYRFSDTAPLPGRSYYRLRQIDFDGTMELFGPIAVDRTGYADDPLRVYPNPSQGDFITLEGNLRSGSRVTLLDATGQTLRNWSWPEASPRRKLPVAGLQPGIYFLRLVAGNDWRTVRLVRQ